MYRECSQAARANLWPVGLKPLAWISYADSLTISHQQKMSMSQGRSTNQKNTMIRASDVEVMLTKPRVYKRTDLDKRWLRNEGV